MVCVSYGVRCTLEEGLDSRVVARRGMHSEGKSQEDESNGHDQNNRICGDTIGREWMRV